MGFIEGYQTCYMNWLQARLDELHFTHRDLCYELQKRGIKRSRAAITGWTNGKSIRLLSNPKETQILAEALNWTSLELLVAVGYKLGIPQELISETIELIPIIQQYHNLEKRRRKLFMMTLDQFALFAVNLPDEELDDALHDMNGGK